MNNDNAYWKPKVYLPQVPTRRNPETGEVEEVHDLSPAYLYGDITPLVSPTCKPFDPDSFLPDMLAGLEDAEPTDYFLPIGNQVLMVAAGIVMESVTGGPLQVLRWDGRERRYDVVTIDFTTIFED